MKIAQIAPLMESVPPRLYGGTERIVAYLTDELVRLGHEVTLFASADSVTAAKFVATIHHGIPADLHTPIYNPRGGYVAFLGRLSPEKRPDRAIRIARALGIPLKIAAKVDKVDESYFREQIAPLLKEPGVEF